MRRRLLCWSLVLVATLAGPTGVPRPALICPLDSDECVGGGAELAASRGDRAAAPASALACSPSSPATLRGNATALGDAFAVALWYRRARRASHGGASVVEYLFSAGAPAPARGDALFTWRGTQAVQQSVARYEGKAQRLDYHLVSEELMPRVERCEILGHGVERAGFLGSDHCPVLLVLRDEAPQPPPPETGATTGAPSHTS